MLAVKGRDELAALALDLLRSAETPRGVAGFAMPGDSIEHPGAASEGCIITPRDVREKVWVSGNHHLIAQ